MYYELGFSDRREMYGRRAVLDRLMIALASIPETFGLVIWDVYRPRAVQAKLFDWMRGEIRRTRPDLSDEQNYAEAKKYMSPPSRVGDEYCPPHLSGGAIDLTLFDRETDQAVEMGTMFDDCSERAHRDYFEHRPDLEPATITVRDNRRVLRTAMERAGFTTYEYEWWHYDIGNAFWANATGQEAAFGPLFGDAEWPCYPR